MTLIDEALSPAEQVLPLGEQLKILRNRKGREGFERFLLRMDPASLSLAERGIAAKLGVGWRSSPAAMAHHLTRGGFKRYRYVEVLSQKIVDAAEGRSTRQIWNLPGRYGKSLLGPRWGTVWIMDRTEGRARMILVSYGYGLAMENAVFVRDALVHHADDLRTQLRPDRRRRDRFVTTAGGGVLAAGISGSITGFGAGDGGGIFVDDPYKDWITAHSASARAKVRDQFKGTIRNRLDDEGAFIIVIHHRVHEDDLTATLKADAENETGDAWEVVAIPALATEGPEFDPLGREIGDPIEAERFPRDAVVARARGMGSYLASGLEQQKPTPEEGNELLRAWFVLAEDAELPSRPDHAISSWDLKLKDREAGDYVVGQVWWRVGDAAWLMGQIRGQYDHATTANAIALLQVRHPEVKRHIIESAGSADEVIPELKRPIANYEVTDEMAARLGMNDAERAAVQELRRSGMGHLQAEPATDGSKAVRARAFISGPAEAGNVRMPASAPFVAALLDEVSAFPNGAHDDQVDAMSQGLKFVRRRRTMRGATAADVQL